MTTWLQHVAAWKDCQCCPLAGQRGRICLARGDLPADIVYIGEAPGISEDALGQPFVGPAGMLLDRIVAAALPVGVTGLYTNLVACFPRIAKEAGDNEPEVDEIMACRPRLIEIVNLARPRLVCHVGALAERYARLAGGVPYAYLDHPAFLLRLPLAAQNHAIQKNVVTLRNAWEDAKATPAEFTEWGTNDGGRSERERLRRIYRDAENNEWWASSGEHAPKLPDGPDDIPF